MYVSLYIAINGLKKMKKTIMQLFIARQGEKVHSNNSIT